MIRDDRIFRVLATRKIEKHPKVLVKKNSTLEDSFLSGSTDREKA